MERRSSVPKFKYTLHFKESVLNDRSITVKYLAFSYDVPLRHLLKKVQAAFLQICDLRARLVICDHLRSTGDSQVTRRFLYGGRKISDTSAKVATSGFHQFFWTLGSQRVRNMTKKSFFPFSLHTFFFSKKKTIHREFHWRNSLGCCHIKIQSWVCFERDQKVE